MAKENSTVLSQKTLTNSLVVSHLKVPKIGDRTHLITFTDLNHRKDYAL
jgi:hypothetical protein